MTPIREKIALRIKELGISKKVICEDLGLVQQNFSTFLTGKRGCPIDDVERLMMYLGLTVRPKDYKPVKVETSKVEAANVDPDARYTLMRQKIRLRINELEQPLNKIATSAGVNMHSLSSYLTGKRGLNIEHVENLLEVLDLTLLPKEGFAFQRVKKNTRGEC